jgi:hypothetical protein
MTMHLTDLSIRDNRGWVVALVEAKNPIDLTPEWAVEIMERILTQSQLRGVRYLLVASQDWGYLRDLSVPNPPQSPNATRFDMRPIIEAYTRAAPPSRRLRHEELKLTLFQWLLDMTLGGQTEWRPSADTPEVQSFVRDIEGGSVSMEDWE